MHGGGRHLSDAEPDRGRSMVGFGGLTAHRIAGSEVHVVGRTIKTVE